MKKLEKNNTKKKIISFAKKNIVMGLLIIVLGLMLLFFLFFNNKINKMYHTMNSTKKECSDTTCYSINCNFEFKDFIKIKKNYNPKKEWFDYNSDTHIPAYERASLDENGIALAAGEYSATTIAQYGLNAYGRYIQEENEEYLKVAINQADYLVEMQDKNGSYYNYYNWPLYGSDETLRAPWGSGMDQGNALSLLARIYYVTKDEKYLEAAKLSLKPLTKDVEDGGLVSYLFGHKFYEEYPASKGNYALNGFMYTLIGLYDFYYITENRLSYELYNEGIETLKFALPFFDSAGISLYHLSHLFYENQPIHYSGKYHMIHIAQLELFYQIEKEETFKYYMDKWTSYVLEKEG